MLPNPLAHLAFVLLVAPLALLAACGSDDDPDSFGDAQATEAQPTATATAPVTSGGTRAPTSESGGATAGAAEAVDVCALMTAAEIEAILGEEVAPGTLDDSSAPYAECRYEASGVTPTVVISVGTWESEDEATDWYEFGLGSEPEIQGVGDRAYRSQPINDITVLHGHYEVIVGLYLVEQSEDEQFESARQIAETIVDRLP